MDVLTHLYNADGEMVSVYTEAQAERLVAGGGWFRSAAEAEAGGKTAASLPGIEAAGSVVTDDMAVTEEPTPPPPPPRKASRGAKGKL